MSLTFTCPKCHTHRLEICETVELVSSEIVDIDEDGECVFEHLENHGNEIDRFQCHNCGFVIKDDAGENIIDMVELVDWIKKTASK